MFLNVCTFEFYYLYVIIFICLSKNDFQILVFATKVACTLHRKMLLFRRIRKIMYSNQNYIILSNFEVFNLIFLRRYYEEIVKFKFILNICPSY